jgi:hypothetical protein
VVPSVTVVSRVIEILDKERFGSLEEMVVQIELIMQVERGTLQGRIQSRIDGNGHSATAVSNNDGSPVASSSASSYTLKQYEL